MILTTQKERDDIIASGKILQEAHARAHAQVRAGITTKELDTIIREYILSQKANPTFLGYKPYGAKRPYPASSCISVNEEVVHGIPTEKEYILQEGDVVSIDAGVTYQGMITDAAHSYIVGSGDDISKKLVSVAEKALSLALTVAYAGSYTGTIGSVIETAIMEGGFCVSPELGGHGTGKVLHEEPFIPNIGDPDTGSKLKKNMVIAIEPICIEGIDPRIKLAADGFTYITKSGLRAAHVEHTIIITDGAPIVCA
ncbi:MAG: type I methionyl aminopeptidase [Alphaproteobacteria bacterium]|nr:type I methionyl aminopeptidase [Alphaproteobacteria bacterium]